MGAGVSGLAGAIRLMKAAQETISLGYTPDGGTVYVNDPAGINRIRLYGSQGIALWDDSGHERVRLGFGDGTRGYVALRNDKGAKVAHLFESAAGVGNLDGPARAQLLDPAFGPPLARAELAVELAPELPAAHAALARARFQEGQVGGAYASLRRALAVAHDHLEARLWLEANASAVLFTASLASALAFLGLAALAAFPRFARDLTRQKNQYYLHPHPSELQLRNHV